MKRLVSFFLAAIAAICLTGCVSVNSVNDVQSVKVILFIGDGMGFNHVANTEAYYNSQMYFSGFEVQREVVTDSLDTLEDADTPTDSAAAATAMATGQKVYNGALSMHNGKSLTSITELAKQKGIGAGIVSSDLISGATPSAFSAHAKSRNDTSDIITSQAKSEIDLFLGRGEGYTDAINKLKFSSEGFTVFEKASNFNVEKEKQLGAFEKVVPSDNTDERPNLIRLTEMAIEYMERHYPKGYFLMIEGAYIDKHSHNNKLFDAMENVVDFSNAVQTAVSMVTGEYSVIVTADHETGGLQLAEAESDFSDGLYTTGKHTGVNVPLYYRSSLTELPQILTNEQVEIDNTDVFYVCKELLAV